MTVLDRMAAVRRSGRRPLIRVRTPGDQCTSGSPAGSGSPAAVTRLVSSSRTTARRSGHGSCSTQDRASTGPRVV